MPAKQPKSEPAKLVYEGRTIYLTGSDETKNEIISWQHTYMDGSRETIALRLDKAYRVGEKDELGTIIKDWVYDTYLTCDFNNNRVKSRSELKADENSKDEPSLDITLN